MKTGFYVKTGVITGLAVFMVFAAGVAVKKYNEHKMIRKFTAVIAKVVDGDTVVLIDGRKVRLLGIDAPETNHPDRPVQKYGEAAKQYLKKRVEGKECVFEYTLNEETDKYGRLLAMVYDGETMINAEMVKKGYAYASESEHISKTKELLVLENIARKFRKGIWETQEGGQAKK
ncbi:MAG TPA: thermonuclease family protein [Candidatus Goldiibacteriota bacterium]|nr:thermonuclease family protein [Candidatus Goldiibacteriota bacterium]